MRISIQESGSPKIRSKLDHNGKLIRPNFRGEGEIILVGEFRHFSVNATIDEYPERIKSL